MCQGCYSSWSFINEQCPLHSLDLAEPARAHQSRVWPCIPDEVWINELWTSNSRITPHKSSNPACRNLQRTKMLEKSTSTLPRIPVWTSWPGRGAAAAERIFQKPPIIWCVGEHNELGRMPNSILYQTNRNFWQDVSAFQRTAHQQTAHAGQRQILLIFSAGWFLQLHLANNSHTFSF